MKAALWMNAAIGESTVKYMEEQLGSDESIYRGAPLWAFYPHEKRWELVLSPKPWPPIIYAGAMEYIPEFEGAF